MFLSFFILFSSSNLSLFLSLFLHPFLKLHHWTSFKETHNYTLHRDSLAWTFYLQVVKEQWGFILLEHTVDKSS